MERIQHQARGGSLVAGERRQNINRQADTYPPHYFGASATRRRRRRVTRRFYVILASAFLLMVAISWIGSYRQIVLLERQIAATQLQISVMKQKNELLNEEIAQMSTDAYIEEAAREQLGMVKEGEKAYAVVTPLSPDDPFYVEKRPGANTSLYH